MADELLLSHLFGSQCRKAIPWVSVSLGEGQAPFEWGHQQERVCRRGSSQALTWAGDTAAVLVPSGAFCTGLIAQKADKPGKV